MRTRVSKIHKVLIVLFLGLVFISFNKDSSKKIVVEKIYTHTDRPFYFPGETIWFKSYIVDSSNKTSPISEVMYADLISPKGSVAKTLKLKIEDGYAYGDFDIKEDWVGGIYTLKMYTNWMRNYGEEVFFIKKIQVQKVVQPNLLMNLKFEKEAYGKSSKVIANFEVKDLKNNLLSNKEISFVVKVGGKKHLSKKIKTDAKGKAKPTFVLPQELVTTDVILNVLIPHKGSVESISRSVPVVLDNLDLQFFPESGKIIAGTKNIIAFKALNEFGKPADVSGSIANKEGVFITNFKSYHDGMGGFNLNAKKGETYFATITKPFASTKKIKLPQVYSQGVRFSVEQIKEKAKISIYTTMQQELQLHVSNTSGPLFSKVIDTNKNTIVVDTQEFTRGITKFSVVGKSGVILAERLIFINPNKKLNISITQEKKNYETREKVTLHIKTTDEHNTPVPSNVSIAVVDNKLLSFADDKQDHIVSNLLLSSELKGKIYKPIFYFDAKEPKAKKALDYVLLTHGWRTYFSDIDFTFKNAKYQPEKESVKSGIVLNKEGIPTKAHLLLFNTYGKQVLAFDTNAHGAFSFKIPKGLYCTLVAYLENKETLQIVVTDVKEAKYSIKKRVLESINKPFKRTIKKAVTIKENIEDIDEPLEENLSSPISEVLDVSLDEDIVELEESVVVGYGVQKKSELTGSIVYIKANSIEEQGDINQVLQGRVAGVQVTNTNGSPGVTSNIQIRGVNTVSGDNEPLYVIDGIPMEGVNALRTINPNQIASISVLKDIASTSLYGMRGSNGVIIITTKSGNHHNKKILKKAKYNNYAVKRIHNSGIQNLYTSKAFYIPVYNSKELPQERTDFRPTIYWNPVVQTNEKGEASVDFYNSDAITSFKITTEGIGYNGLVGRVTEDYSTKKLLNIDFKTPNYLSVNDIVELPITITNDSDEDISAILNLELPESIKLIEPVDEKITVAANTSILKNIKVVALKKEAKAIIKALVKSKVYEDMVNKEVTIVSPYFPTEVSISGIKNQTFEFNVENVIANSLAADFKIYTDIVGDVMDGIESIIRQPYGCFEQVSSSTYPNILVLQYLKETGKTNPEIEEKALKYIKDGYKKLAAYETKENGFEWYGNTPPHEALSAYGLMEFKEMAEVYNGVDQKMIERTIQWLLSRKNSKGGFKQNNGKYGFSGAPKKVNNAYIVYAISESGIATNISKEYEATLQEALKSKDIYRMSLLAISSYNLGKMENYNTLISEIKESIVENGYEDLPVSNTITRSYGDSKNIETTAFTIMALLKNKEATVKLVAEGIEYLLAKRKNGRFGSTQATSMALKALIEYTKTQKAKIIAEGDIVELIVNGTALKEKLKINDTGKIVINGIENYIKEGKQNIAVKFSNKERGFPYSLDIKWDSDLPESSKSCKVAIQTKIQDKTSKIGDIVRMKVEVKNKKDTGIPSTTAIIGIPSGAAVQPWQLKELLEQNKVAYYELFDNYLVLYWREFGPSEIKLINLDLKAEIAGKYTAPASCVYLYYEDESKKWISGNELFIN